MGDMSIWILDKMYIVFGVIVGVLINKLVIRPLERQYYRKLCKKEKLIPKLSESEDN